MSRPGRRGRERGGKRGTLALILALLAACAVPEEGAREGGAAEGDTAEAGLADGAAIGPTGGAVAEEGAPQSILRLDRAELTAEVEPGTGRMAVVRRPPAAPIGEAGPAEAGPAEGVLPALGPFAEAADAEEGQAAAGQPRRARPDPEADRESDLALAEARRDLGLALEAAGDIEAAVSEFEAALAAARARGGAEAPWSDLARICRRGEPAAAVARACTRVLRPARFAPDEIAGFLVNRGNAHARLGRAELAMSDYRAALRIDSSNFGALVGRARLNVAEGRPAAALNDLRLAIATGPRPAEARMVRARAWRALGEPGRALEDYDAVLADERARAWHPTAWRERAETHCAIGRPDASAVGWQVWADSVPSGPVYVQELLSGRGYLKGPWEPGIGDATLAALRAWTREGCP